MMCGVCRIKGENNHFKNGDQYAETATFYTERTDEGNPLQFFVCRLHSIELFKVGERRFLDKYAQLKQGIQRKINEINSDFDNLNPKKDEPKPLIIRITVS